MTIEEKRADGLTVFIAQSHLTTESNKTGTWRFLRPRYDEKTAPCSATCPAGEDIGRIEMLTAQGLFKEAWETILRENPLPAVCGRVCYHPCEGVCNRKSFDDPIAIHTLERFLADTAVRFGLKPDLDRLAARKQRIAIIGSGPSGLAAGYFLSRLGYACDVFESMPEPGGVLRWGVPSYRLPAVVLGNEIEQIKKAGFEIQCGKSVSRGDLDAMAGFYDAIFLGCGHWRGTSLNIPGEDLEGVADGLQFLQRIRHGDAVPPVRGRVAVVGGGNTAIDVARSVLRLGAKPILIYRRRCQDMPGFQDEVQMALEEGVELMELRTPIRIERQDGEYSITLQQMRIAEVVEGAGISEGGTSLGRSRVEPVPHQTETLRVAQVFKAIGLEAAEDWYDPPEDGMGRMRLEHSILTYENRKPVLVYGGDLAVRLKSVVHAVASGKEAAMALDTLFQEGPEAIQAKLNDCKVGNGASQSMEVYMRGARCARNPHIVTYVEINADHFQFAPRIIQPRLLKEERVRSFSEIDLRVSGALAMREAERCFNCGLCNQCDNCRIFCPDLSVVREDTPQGRRINYDYCKGCGICVVECPRNAMILEEEQEG